MKYKRIVLRPGDRWPVCCWHAPVSEKNYVRAQAQLKWFNDTNYSLKVFQEDYITDYSYDVDVNRYAIIPDIEPETNEFGTVIP